MNDLKGKIETIHVSGSLTLATIKVEQTLFSVIVVDTPDSAPYLKPGNPVHVIFKETEVIIGKGHQHEISLRNKLAGRIQSVESGELLSKLLLDTEAGRIVSIITTNAVDQLQLKVGSEITAMVKTNEIMLSE